MDIWQEIVNKLGYEPPDHSLELKNMVDHWDMSNHPLMTPVEQRESLIYKAEMAARRSEKLNILKNIGY